MSQNIEQYTQTKCVRVNVLGRVQGVGFRYFTQTAARRYSLVGWVRNNYDGSVEILAEGPEEDLKAFLELIKKGSSSSFVRKVNITWESPQSQFNSFSIRT